MKEIKAKVETDKLLDWEVTLKSVQHNINEAKMGTVVGGMARARLEHALSLLEEVTDQVKREYINAF